MCELKVKWIILGIMIVLVGCGPESEDNDPKDNNSKVDESTLEIGGQWISNYDASESIADGKWMEMDVIEFSNENNWAVTQNASDAEFGPELFNKIVWTKPVDDSFYYCMVDYGLESAQAAKDTTKVADDKDPATGGCGDFPWTKLTLASKVLEVRGSWWSNFNAGEVISGEQWGESTIVSFDNENNWAVTQNASDAEFGPGLFNKLVWTESVDGSFYYCTVDYGLDTADAARETVKMADDKDPAVGGCGDFSWTKLTDRALVIETVGQWASNFETEETISPQLWDKMTIVEHDNKDNWAVTQNPEDSEFDAGKYLKIVWTKPVDDSFYYCMVDYGLESAQAAKDTTKVADDKDPATGGCGDFPWTKLTRK